ncbi:MerR family transcriptional regulator [Robinsoniella sp. KNHs210]|uniref:MerR family transcriptional regulator n=1 Tax=Robinsoniella sp. KNHs210 TaxID=1469950 RepID=UPI0004864975|nr:MerR family transcriptional regulator [Robinsoniella sp. KNHs210]
MTIKEVEEELNVTRANVRFYEKEGLLTARRNPINGYRDYSRENIETLKKIIFLRKLNVPIEEIKLVQLEKLSMEEMLHKQADSLEAEIKQLEQSRWICLELVKNQDFDYANLTVERYEDAVDKSGYMIFRDTISNLAAMKGKIAIWSIIIFSFILAFISYPLLPEGIVVWWNDIGKIVYGDKLLVFIFPVIASMLVFTARSWVWNFLYRNMPYYMLKVDAITTIVCLYLSILLLTSQLYAIFYHNWISWPIESSVIVETLIFLFILLVIAYKKKKEER